MAIEHVQKSEVEDVWSQPLSSGEDEHGSN